MTRINLIPPHELTTRHLVAEYRELPRVFALAKKAQPQAILPSAYTLGAGHVRFFYNKAGWLLKRQRALIAEMQRRGYKPQHTDPSPLADGLPLNDWDPPPAAVALSRARIEERLNA